MTDLEIIRQKLREDFARAGGNARRDALTPAERKRIAKKAGSAPKKRKAKK